ncbi:hypothetical protein ACFW04_002072 [Cataglyphis niger]
MDTVEANYPEKQTATNPLMIRYHVYSRRIRMMLYLGGVLQDRTHSAIRTYIVGFSVILMSLSHCIFLINLCRDHTDNLMLMVKYFSQIGSFVAPALMSACFLIKRKKLIELHETLNDMFERELERDQEAALATLYAFDRPFCIVFFTIATTVLLYICPPLISIIYQIIHHIEPRRYKFPFPAKFPWTVPINDGFIFYLHFLYHLFLGWWTVFTISSVDSLFGFYAFQISSILYAMSVKLRSNLQPRGTFSEILETCVWTHRRLCQCSNTLENIWQPIILRMLLANSILICILIFEVTQVTDIIMSEIFLLIFYITLKLLQTFMYAWYGNFITSASEYFREGIYFSDWPDSSLDCHVRTNIIMTMMQKPMTIKALKVTSVNVNMFTNIVNTAVSYFFLLQSLDEGR